MKLGTFLTRHLQFAWVITLLICCFTARADDTSPAGTNSTKAMLLNDDPDKAWKQVQKANQPPFPPSEWSTNSPTQEEQDNFFAPKLMKASDMAQEFYTRFPTHAKAPAARELEHQLLRLAISKFDQTNQMARLMTVETKLLSDTNTPDKEKIEIRMQKLAELQQKLPASLPTFTAEARAMTHDYPKREEGWQAMMVALSLSEGASSDALAKEISEGDAPEKIKAKVKIEQRVPEIRKLMAGLPATAPALEKSARDVLHDFPKEDLGYEVLMFLMQNSDPDKAKSLATEIASSSAPDQIKEQAQGLLKSMEQLNQPVDIKYSAVDGREVNVATMKDKVVLVDFWATWCGPCMAELPNVKAAYAKYHDQGFEIIGISLDEDKDKLESTLKSKGMTWPQFFDGQGWKNKIAQQYGINSIPAMWLVDKQGKLADMDARDGLESKIEKLLAKKY